MPPRRLPYELVPVRICLELRAVYIACPHRKAAEPEYCFRYPSEQLLSLWQDDLIRKVSVEGTPDRYDRIQRHDHLVCKECGKLLDVDLGDLTAQLEQKAGTAILSYDLKLVYLCDECRKKKGM